MGIARSTYYDRPVIEIDDTAIVAAMGEIADTSRLTAIGVCKQRCASVASS